jgi:hypothetical protein
LWREQHPLGHEQTALDFKTNFQQLRACLWSVRCMTDRGSP